MAMVDACRKAQYENLLETKIDKTKRRNTTEKMARQYTEARVTRQVLRPAVMAVFQFVYPQSVPV